MRVRLTTEDEGKLRDKRGISTEGRGNCQKTTKASEGRRSTKHTTTATGAGINTAGNNAGANTYNTYATTNYNTTYATDTSNNNTTATTTTNQESRREDTITKSTNNGQTFDQNIRGPTNAYTCYTDGSYTHIKPTTNNGRTHHD